MNKVQKLIFDGVGKDDMNTLINSVIKAQNTDSLVLNDTPTLDKHPFSFTIKRIKKYVKDDATWQWEKFREEPWYYKFFAKVYGVFYKEKNINDKTIFDAESKKIDYEFKLLHIFNSEYFKPIQQLPPSQGGGKKKKYKKYNINYLL